MWVGDSGSDGGERRYLRELYHSNTKLTFPRPLENGFLKLLLLGLWVLLLTGGGGGCVMVMVGGR